MWCKLFRMVFVSQQNIVSNLICFPILHYFLAAFSLIQTFSWTFWLQNEITFCFAIQCSLLLAKMSYLLHHSVGTRFNVLPVRQDELPYTSQCRDALQCPSCYSRPNSIPSHLIKNGFLKREVHYIKLRIDKTI